MANTDILNQVLDTALKVSTEKDRVVALFEKSGMTITSDMGISSIVGDQESVSKILMQNLSEMAVVKIAAKQIFRKAGISF